MSSRSSSRGRIARTSWAAAAFTTASADPSNPTVTVVPVGPDFGDSWECAELVAVDGCGELDLQALDGDLAEVLERVDDHEPALAEDRQAVGDALDLRQGVRGQEHRAALGADLAEERVKALLHEGIQTGDRLIQDQQLGFVHEGLDQSELLSVAGRQLADRAIEIGVEALGQGVAHARVDSTAELREVVEHHPPGQLRVHRQITGQEADPSADLEAVLAHVEPEHPSRARGRPDQVQQQSHRGRLARTVGTEKAEHLALLDLQVELEQPTPGAVVLRQTARGNHGLGAHGKPRTQRTDVH